MWNILSIEHAGNINEKHLGNLVTYQRHQLCLYFYIYIYIMYEHIFKSVICPIDGKSTNSIYTNTGNFSSFDHDIPEVLITA